jgi:Fe-S oxidoreductase
MDVVTEHKKKCTLCGQCLKVCPRYDDLSLIKKLYMFLEGNLEIDSDSLLRCLTCGLCTFACPQGLGIKPLINPARKKWVSEKGLTERQTMVDPDAQNNLFKKIAEMDETPIYKDSPGSVVYFPGCAGTYINITMAKAAVTLLEKAGVDYTVLSGVEYCCGAVSAGSGNLEPIRRNGLRNITEFRKKGASILITACPGCFKAFKDIYPRMFGKLDFQVMQVSQYLDVLLREGKLSPELVLNHRIFYHDPCHLIRGMGVFCEARNVLENIKGTELVNKNPETSGCCGFGGGVRVNYPSESLAIASDRFRAAEKLGCDTIITNCGGCMQNLIEAGKDERIKVFDLSEYLSLACGLKIEREDQKMLKIVNKAYRFCISNYCGPDTF